MAHRTATMQALGSEPPCDGCGQPHQRGSQMSAVASDEGEPLGWFCETCLAKWRAGHDPRFPEKEEQTDG